MVRKWPFSRLKTGGFLLTRSFVDTDPNTRRVIEDSREAVKQITASLYGYTSKVRMAILL